MVRKILVVGAVMVVAIAAGASAASSGLYTGKTSQKLKITLTVSKGKLVKFDYAARYGSCGELTGADNPRIAIKHQKFSATVHPNSETTDRLSGTFVGTNVTGILNSSVTTGGIHPTTCKSGKVKFSAKL